MPPLAWHGATHLSLADETCERSITLELELASRIFTSLGRRPECIVFPRNRVGHLCRLHSAGFRTYRDSADRSGLGRVVSLLNELNAFSRCERRPPELRGGWRVCRPGDFLNWPRGARALAPTSATIARWKSMLRDAAETGGTAHMWFHPHNLITAPAMQTSFEEIMRFAGELTRNGDLANLTMGQSVAFLDGAQVA